MVLQRVGVHLPHAMLCPPADPAYVACVKLRIGAARFHFFLDKFGKDVPGPAPAPPRIRAVPLQPGNQVIGGLFLHLVSEPQATMVMHIAELTSLLPLHAAGRCGGHKTPMCHQSSTLCRPMPLAPLASARCWCVPCMQHARAARCCL